jgi:hypothetical protein
LQEKSSDTEREKKVRSHIASTKHFFAGLAAQSRAGVPLKCYHIRPS